MASLAARDSIMAESSGSWRDATVPTAPGAGFRDPAVFKGCGPGAAAGSWPVMGSGLPKFSRSTDDCLRLRSDRTVRVRGWHLGLGTFPIVHELPAPDLLIK
eukprot:757847-Hanusia_phi.AAC.7